LYFQNRCKIFIENQSFTEVRFKNTFQNVWQIDRLGGIFATLLGKQEAGWRPVVFFTAVGSMLAANSLKLI
jgi:putative lipase involved disintegration of autophagic bodies